MKYIIDTNVPKKASNTHDGNALDIKCALECLKFISVLMQSKDIVVLDADSEIYREYAKNLQTKKQDDIGMMFLKWIQRNMTLKENGRVEFCKINKTESGGYAEFPSTPTLSGFDEADQKFIALALSHPDHPQIIEGTDRLWWKYKDALKNAGVNIVFLCEDYVK